MKRKKQDGEAIRRQYAQLAAEGRGALDRAGNTDPARPAMSLGYSQEEIGGVPEGALEMGLGCGNPTALAELRPGLVVLDLGSGAGLDAFIAARKVEPGGIVIGVDMTAEMVERANRFAREGGYRNVEFKIGRIQNLPLADETIDVIISNCVINHASDKLAVFREARRVLRPDGRLCVSDLVLEGRPPPPGQPGLEVWAEWLTLACGKKEYLAAIRQAGFRDVAVVAECSYGGPGMVAALAGKIVSLRVKARK